jgi:hypothetical protein
LASNKVLIIIDKVFAKICAKIGIKFKPNEIFDILFLKKVTFWQKIGGIGT